MGCSKYPLKSLVQERHKGSQVLGSPSIFLMSSSLFGFVSRGSGKAEYAGSSTSGSSVSLSESQSPTMLVLVDCWKSFIYGTRKSAINIPFVVKSDFVETKAVPAYGLYPRQWTSCKENQSWCQGIGRWGHEYGRPIGTKQDLETPTFFQQHISITMEPLTQFISLSLSRASINTSFQVSRALRPITRPSFRALNIVAIGSSFIKSLSLGYSLGHQDIAVLISWDTNCDRSNQNCVIKSIRVGTALP